ncbi:MAG: glycosyltransferase family 2 protein [Bacteroidota bacterium]
MRIGIIIPAHNEALYLKDCLETFVAQSRVPHELIVVDDNSSDNTFAIANSYAKEHNWIKVLQRRSSNEHIPGKKVVDTFNFGLQHAADHELIGKFDADILLPKNYFEAVCHHFQHLPNLGLCSGLLYIKKDNEWVYENIADITHVRGPIKLYRKACLEKMDGLRPSIGWDTVDTLLAQYHGFEILTDPYLKVRHLRPTGMGYRTQNHRAKGEALYKMRYGLVLAKIAAFKMAWQAKSVIMYVQLVLGYLSATIHRVPRLVTKEEGTFIRSLRWKGVRAKLSKRYR